MTNGGQAGNRWHQKAGNWVRTNTLTKIAYVLGATALAAVIYNAGKSQSDLHSYEPDRGMTPKGIMEGPDGKKYNNLDFDAPPQDLDDISNLVQDRVTYRPRGPRSLIVYKIPEKELATVLRLVNVAKNEIKREHGQYYRELVWQAALIDPRTGKIDPQKLHQGFGWVDAQSYLDPNKIACNYRKLLANR